MFTQLLTTAAALLLLGAGPVHADYIRWAGLARTVGNNTRLGYSWGTVVVSARGNSLNTTTGLVCDDYMDSNTADFLCRAAGFPHGQEFWTNNDESYYNGNRISSSAFYKKYNGSFALDNFRCPAGAQRLDDCYRLPVGTHNCGYSEGVVVKCRTEARGVDLDNFGVQMQKGSGILSNNGTVVLNGTYGSSGLVCAEGINQRTAEVLCNDAGYDYLVGYNTTKDISSSSKLDCDTMRGRNMSVIAENLSCPSNATDLGDCSASMANGTCDADTALWLSCTNDDSEHWELANITLARNEAGHHERSDLRTGDNFGTVLVTVRNTRTGEERTGFTPYSYSSYTRSSMCYNTGNTNRYPSYRRTGQISDSSNTKVSCAYTIENELNFVLSYLWCPGYYMSLSRCNFNLAPEGYNPGSDNAFWLNC